MNESTLTFDIGNICPICKKVRVYLISTASNPPIYRYECGCDKKDEDKPRLGGPNASAK